jgi:release factor glutamine methyltransferase
MEIIDKTIEFAANYFREELKNTLSSSELEQTLQITLSHYFKLERVDLVLKKDDVLSDIDFQKINDVITAIKTNKPLAQIIGEWEFYGLSLKVNKHTLIPRPETEELVQLIIEENSNDELSILDIGTGTGCIPLALKKEIPNAYLYAYDVSEEALKVAHENSIKNKLAVTFSKVDILADEAHGLKDKFDIIVSNPPYITNKEKALMHTNVLDYEPHLALFVDDTEPLLFYNAIANFAINHLNKNGKLYFEINEHYGNDVVQLLLNKSFKNVNIVKDINDRDRIVSCNI